MSMLKKLLAVALTASISAGAAIAGTVAYLQDEDSDVNVMTLGNVDIEQHEYQRVVNADGTFATDTIDNQTSYVLEGFDQMKPLLPIVGDPSSPAGYPYAGYDTIPVRMSQVDSYGGMDVFAGKNAQDKFVTVENTGKSDAYVRTVVALEVGTANPELLGTSYHKTWTKNNIGIVEIDGNNYSVTEYVYAGAAGVRHDNGVLPAGDTTYPSLSQVYIGSDATNEDMEKLDGNGNGTYDILVLSQAIQVEGFDNATAALTAGFGEANATNVAAWFTGEDAASIPTVVDTVDELKAALETEESNIVVEAGTYDMGGSFSVKEGVTVAGEEGTVFKGTLTNSMKNVTFKNIEFTGSNAQRWAYAKGDVVFENCTFNGTGVYAIHYDGTSGANITYKNCDINGWVAITGGHESLTFDGCTIKGNGTYGVIRTYGDATIKNCTFDVANVNTTDVYQDGIHAVDCTITVENCTNVNGTIEAIFNVSGTGKIDVK